MPTELRPTLHLLLTYVADFTTGAWIMRVVLRAAELATDGTDD